jgi:pyruvate dehydrogenase E2 component (dihydrolipoamide acetyltransferase)
MTEVTNVVVAMPHMGVSVEEGTVIEWLKAAGEEVAAEEVICAIATDKVDTEVLAPADGVLTKIVAAAGETVAVGEPIAELAVGAEAATAESADAPVGSGSPDATPRGSDVAAASGGGAPRRVSGEPDPTAAPVEAVAISPHADAGDGNDTSATDSGLAARAAAGRDEFGRFDPKAAAEAVVGFVAGATGGAKLASPVAKRMAAKHGIDLGVLQGSGRRGRIRKADVLGAISSSSGTTVASSPAPAAAAPPGADGLPLGYEGVPHEVVKTTRVRQLIAEHMIRSRQTAAHMTTEVDVDLTAVVRARAELNASRRETGDPKLSYLPFIARAACVALGEHPDLNATFLGDRMIRWQTVNLGVAVDTPEGLLVPVVPGCDRLTAPTIGDAIGDLAERARTRKLTPDDLAGGTFTLSNPGSVGAVSAPAIINQPQVAILGVPTIQRRPWVVEDEFGEEAIAIRPILRLAVTFDHRAVDGAGATRFAVAVKERLEDWGPEAYT